MPSPPRADSTFGRVDASLVDALRDAVGVDFVHVDAEHRRAAASDETEDLVFLPDVVVEPGSTAEVSAVMRLATRARVPVTPRGAGTGLSGGALPVCGGIALSTRRLDRILEIDRENLMAVVQPAVITQVLQEAVEAEGLFYPPDPASRGSCFIGGNVAECSGGPRAVKYGVTRDWVLGVEAVLPDGRVVRHGGKLLKNVTGYNLTQLLVGSEGTLAIVTEVTLRLIPLPRHRVMLVVPFERLDDCARAVPAILHAGIVPSVLELLEREAIAITEAHLGASFPHGDAAGLLMIELDGNDEGVIMREAERVTEVVLGHGARDVLLADDGRRMKELWTLRRAVGEAVKSVSVYKEEDTVVPRRRLVDLLVGVKAIARRHDIRTVCYGHAGDGNLHVNILRMDMDEAEWNERLDPVIREIFRLTVSLGGTISGEHGVGWVQRDYVPIAMSRDEIELMRAIKRAFDPHGILNPRKLLPDPDAHAPTDGQ